MKNSSNISCEEFNTDFKYVLTFAFALNNNGFKRQKPCACRFSIERTYHSSVAVMGTSNLKTEVLNVSRQVLIKYAKFENFSPSLVTNHFLKKSMRKK